jgi:hypothetical protein
MAAAAVLKTFESCNLGQSLTDFDDIWYTSTEDNSANPNTQHRQSGAKYQDGCRFSPGLESSLRFHLKSSDRETLFHGIKKQMLPGKNGKAHYPQLL